MKRILYIVSLLLCLPALALNVEARGASQDLEQAAQFIPQSQSGAQGVQPSVAQQAGQEAEPRITAVTQPGSQSSQQISYNNVRIERMGEYVNITFEVTAGRKSVKRGEHLILTPVLFNDTHKVSLPTIAVQSRRAQLQAFRSGVRPGSANIPAYRHSKQSGSPAAPAYVTRNGGKILYSTRIPYTETLTDVFLGVERKEQRCGRAFSLSALTLTDKPALVPAVTYTPHYGLPVPRLSVADSLSKLYPFIAPIADFERSKQAKGYKLFDLSMPLNMGKGASEPQQSAVEQFVANNEKGAVQINFSRGGTTIDRYYKENNTSLVTLASVLKEIQASNNSQVAKVVIAGFASPDGTLESNDRLAWSRADAVRGFVRNNSTVTMGTILTYNGSEDWRGLRKLVEESDIEAKYEILYIIDNVPVLSGREGQLMNLAGGRPYTFMLRYFFPQLRNAAYIKVYYTATQEQSAPSENMRKAVSLMNEGNYAAALSLLAGEPDTANGAVNTSVGDASNSLRGGGVLNNLRGVCYMMSGDTAQAATYFNAAVEQGNADAVLNLQQLSAPMQKSGANR